MQHGRNVRPKDGPIFETLEDTGENRRAVELWLQNDFVAMVRNGVLDHGWSDRQAVAKAHEALAIVLSPFEFDYPPLFTVEVKNGHPKILVHWFSNTEVH